MSTVQAPFGLEVLRNDSGGCPRNRLSKNAIASGYATNIFIGDPIKLNTDGQIELAAAGEAIDGIFNGCSYVNASGDAVFGDYWRAGTVASDVEVIWYPAKSLTFRVQADGSVDQAAIGAVADLVIGAGRPQSRKSTTAMSSTIGAAGTSAQVKIVDVYEMPGNEWGDAFTEVEVMINEQALGTAVGNAI